MVAVSRETVTELFEAAAARWPAVRLPRAAFASRLVDLVGDEPDPDAAARARATDELYLVWACLDHVPRAHEAFERNYLAQVPAWVKRVVRSEARADEVRQEVAKRLLTSEGGAPPKLATYSGKGPLGGWLRVTATRVAQNVREQQHSLRGVPLDPGRAASDLDPEVAALRRIYARQFADALRTTLLTLDRDERTVLRLHYLEGLSIEEVGAAYRVSRATAARMLARARDGILAKMHELLAQELGPTAPESASLLVLIQNELEESLSRRLDE